MKKWEIINKFKVQNSKLKVEELINLLLQNRGIKTKKERDAFLHPRLEDVIPSTVGIDPTQLKKTLARIKKAIDEQQQIIVFGDYDVDGITGSAILWETLFAMHAKVLPYIPSRIDEGYGLSQKALENPEFQKKNAKLIITVDNGIVANDAVALAKKQGIDVIITDHHAQGDKQPDAIAIIHTTKLCGAGVAYVLSKELKKIVIASDDRSEAIPHMNRSVLKEANLTPKRIASSSSGTPRNDTGEREEDKHLELATLGTVADLVPLTGANRAIVKHGLEKVCKSKRPGLQELCKQAGLAKDIFGVYEIGFIIAPRLNAAGRIESAMDSLRLLCTKDQKRAKMLAEKLELTNKERQLLMRDAAEHAIDGIRNNELGIKKLLFAAHETYKEGVIGLVAGKLVEEFYRPAIVLSVGKTYSKGSARSVSGFNMIEFLRSVPQYYINVGGHPMAAGFTIATEHMAVFQSALAEKIEERLTDDLLVRTLRIDCELPLSAITQDLYDAISQLGPFGMGNPEPVFVSRGVTIDDMRVMGRDGKHLKLKVKSEKFKVIEAVAFGMGERAAELLIGDIIDVVYTIDENRWNGNVSLQLKIKDINQKQR